MDLSFSLLLSLFTFIILLGANHASLESEIYWRTILPDTPMPSAIAKLLKPNVHDEMPDVSTSVHVGHGGDGMGGANDHIRKLSFPFPIYSDGKGGANDHVGKLSFPFPIYSSDFSDGKGGANDHVRKLSFPFPIYSSDFSDGKGGANDHVRKLSFPFPIYSSDFSDGMGGANGKGGANDHVRKLSFPFPIYSSDFSDGKGGANDHVRKLSFPFPIYSSDFSDGMGEANGKGGANDHVSFPFPIYSSDFSDGKGGANDHVRKLSFPFPIYSSDFSDGMGEANGKGGANDHVRKLSFPFPIYSSDFSDGMGGAQVHNGKQSHSSKTQLQDDPTLAIFFFRQDLRRGKNFTLQLAVTTATAAFIPRSAAESVPFSTVELPSILSRFGIPPGSGEAATMEKTLSQCEAAPVAGEKSWCATSLESMVDFATGSLGTREVVPAETEGGGASVDELLEYTVGAVRTVVAAGKPVVVCHPLAYAYAVFLCHATATSEVYEVQMAAVEGGEKALKAVAVCHTDTSGWNPNHLSFLVLKVKPGTVPVCHFLPRDHVVWTAKV